ncbi:GIP [Symbiodinium sp. CCMP2592]|nr:GIP [Symbiodinium sp. CCMP2592]
MSAEVNHQQGMSPTLRVLEGEDNGPAYQDAGRSLRPAENGREQNDVAGMPNGVTRPSPAPPRDDSGVEAPQVAQHIASEGSRAASDGLRQLPVEGTAAVQGLQVPDMMIGESAPGDQIRNGASGAPQLPLFPQFVPSPLPGQSPVDQGRTGPRAGSWFSRLGDYIQKRVEVTAWTAPPSATSPEVHGTWHNQSQVQTMMMASPSRQEHRPDSVSSGSGGIPQEMVQAEVTRQLDAAMSEVMARLSAERQRTEQATMEAQRLRAQLERYELRMQAPVRENVAEPPGLELDGHGVHTRILVAVEFTPEFPCNLLYLVLLVLREEQSQGHSLQDRGRSFKVSSVGAIAMIQLLCQALVQVRWVLRLVQIFRDHQCYLLYNHQSHLQREPRRLGLLKVICWLLSLEALRSIDLLNWITHIGPLMEDLSDTSSMWWQMTLKDALTWYSQYSAAPPLERLQLKPQASMELQKPEWIRVERRATAMMLSAVPKQVREEVISGGHVNSLHLLCKLYSVYQPGNLQEKSLVLRMLEQPDACASALEAVESLQRWNLWRRRAASIGMAEPDASVLLRGLDRITGQIVKANSELSFRVSLIRSTLQVDVSPSAASITTFLQHLQAEMEQQARLSSVLVDTAAAVRAVTTTGAPPPPPTAPATTTTTKGAGSLCKFFASEKGSKNAEHLVEAPPRKVNFEGDGVIQAKVMKVLAGLQDIPLFRTRSALLDSGATHVLRGPKSEEEWDHARNVHVQLAGDSYASMKQNEAGSLLNGDQLAQVIVPMGRVISTLGFSLKWTKEICQLEGPDGEVVQLDVVRGCPQVSEKVAQDLIARLEEAHLPELQQTTAASVRALKAVKASWWSCLMEYSVSGNVASGQAAIDKAPFMNYRDMMKEILVISRPRKKPWDLMKELSLNRRSRKRLMNSASWVVRWDAPTVERRRDDLKQLSLAGDTIYVNVNTLLVESEFVDVWRILSWAASVGKIGTVVSRDSPGNHLDQIIAPQHRSKIHFLHALSTAGRTVHGQGKAQAEVWPAWSCSRDAQDYMTEMGIMDISVERFTGERHFRIAKMDADAAWATMHPMAYTLSVDVVGPLKGYGKSPDGKYFKYFVIGAFRIPDVHGGHGHADVKGHPIPPPDSDGHEDDEEDQLSEDEVADDEGPVEADYVDASQVEREKEQWRQLLSTFKEPISTTTLYFAVPVNNKKAATMLPAVQKIVMDVKALGYPVTRLHSDRGGEFRGHLVRRWALSQGMWPTTTSGSESASNGVAESGVRYLKRRARILLDSGGISKENWPTAVQYAAAQQRCDQLGVLPPLPVAYGTKVYVKTKKYKTGAVEDFGHHWVQGKYVGPSTDIRGGHVILKSTGTFVQTTHVRIAQEPPPLDEARGVVQDDSIMKYLRVEEIQYVEKIAQHLYQDRKFGEDHIKQVLGVLGGTCGNLKVPRAPGGHGLVIGAYVHGGSFGVTRYGRDLPWVAQYLNGYVAHKINEHGVAVKPTWTTLAIQAADQIPRHRDVHNERGTYNYVCEVKAEPTNGLWVEDKGYERRVVGDENPRDYQLEGQDGDVRDGCLVDITQKPAVLDPLAPHAYVKGDGVRWFLSAYTPQGAYKLKQGDQDYLQKLKFPLSEEENRLGGGTPETTPVLKASSLPSELPSGTCSYSDDVDEVFIGDCEGTLWDWAMYVEEELPAEVDGDDQANQVRGLRKVCGSDDPAGELPALLKASDVLLEEEISDSLQDDLVGRLEYWCGLDVQQGFPCMAKMEPEYTEGVEDIIKKAVQDGTPLRHTYNVSPKEARSEIERWRPAIEKEVGVVEKGFQRIHVKDIEKLKAEYNVQERKARIVCCGNFASDEAGDIFAGGAAAESLRCALTYTTARHWIPGIVDVTGAFMLTPLPQGKGVIKYIIRPPAALVQLGLATESERWLLTHGMYGLRQSPRLWQEYRDSELKQLKFDHEGRTWSLQQGRAEPNLWMVYEVGCPDGQPSGGLILVYVDDIMLAGPRSLIESLASTIGRIWKVSELDVLSVDRDIRFLGCEISTNDSMDCIYIHQRPYINEILRHHDISPQALSFIQAPREMVTFEPYEGEDRGTDQQIKEAQRLCGELLWLAQRSRPDVAYVVSAMGSLLSKAAPRCIAIGLRLLSYLQQTRDMALTLRSVSEELVAYSDSSFAPSGARSFSGIVLSWRGSPITWRAAKQPFVCLSTAECELVASIEALTMARSLQAILHQIDPARPMLTLGIDNQAAIAIASPSTTASWRTRHLRVRAAYLHEQIEEKMITLRYVPGKDQWADLLTKSFPRQRLQELTALWGFVDEQEEPLALTTSFELYVMIAVFGIAMAYFAKGNIQGYPIAEGMEVTEGMAVLTSESENVARLSDDTEVHSSR